MKQFTAFILLSFIATASLAQNDLVFPIQEGAVSDWKYVSDRVMGAFLRAMFTWKKMEIPHLQGSLVM